MALRVGLDVHVLNGPHQGTVSVWNTLLAALPPEHRYVLFSFNPIDTQRAFSAPWFEHRRIPLQFGPLRIGVEYPVLARLARCDVFHVNYFGPPFGVRGLVSTVQDVLYLDVPELVPARRRIQFRYLAGLTSRRARRVITASEYTRSRILHHFGIDPNRVSVVRNALGRGWLQPDNEAVARAWPTVTPPPPPRYLLSVGRLEPRKNHIVAARLARSLRRDGLIDGLVIVGAEDFGGEELRQQLAQEGLADTVRHYERVTRTQLQALYRNSAALTFLSKAEGFGLPLLEAMAMRTPIVAANRAALPEVGADAAVFVDPDDEKAVLEAARTVITDVAVRERLLRSGLKRAAEFTPERMAAETVAVYARAAD